VLTNAKSTQSVTSTYALQHNKLKEKPNSGAIKPCMYTFFKAKSTYTLYILHWKKLICGRVIKPYLYHVYFCQQTRVRITSY